MNCTFSDRRPDNCKHIQYGLEQTNQNLFVKCTRIIFGNENNKDGVKSIVEQVKIKQRTNCLPEHRTSRTVCVLF